MFEIRCWCVHNKIVKVLQVKIRNRCSQLHYVNTSKIEVGFCRLLIAGVSGSVYNHLVQWSSIRMVSSDNRVSSLDCYKWLQPPDNGANCTEIRRGDNTMTYTC